MADLYLLVKTLHILSATMLFGTGLGIAFFFWRGSWIGDDRASLFAAETTVIADMIFTLTAGIVQPLTGAWLIHATGADPFSIWLLATYALYLLALACWLPVVRLQLGMRDQLRVKVAGGGFDARLYERRRRWWFALGWPAFLGLVAVFFLMVAKPQ